MWNAKRILIFILGFAGCLAAYSVYALVFGGYNELAPLPKDYLPGTVEPHAPPPPTVQQYEMKTRQAWGNECPELTRHQYYDSDAKGILIRINDFDILKDDGRVRMTDFSAAIFPKGSPNAAYPEINTITAKYCLLTLDRPVSSISELGNRKIMQVELQGPGIVITNNRKTAVRNDDITISIEGSSLFYEEPKDLIWTNGTIRFQENQPDPETKLNTMLTEVDAQGLDLFLSKDSSPNRPKGPKQPLPPGKYSAVSGVEKLVLKSNIRMFTTVSGQSSMFTDMKEPAADKQPSKPKPADKRYITVYTNGKMSYDLLTEQAVFDRRPSMGDPVASDRVTVLRSTKPGEEADDRLDCEHLKLAFRRKQAATTKNDGSGGKEIAAAVATGDVVSLTMNKDNLAAHGSELRYESPTGETGAKTILIGEKMIAIREGHKIQARELHLIGANKKGEGKHAYAKGPGHIELFDKKDPERPYPHHMFWQDTLLVKTDVIGKSVFEKITLVGDAAFLDEINKNRLDAHTLQVWLEETNGKDNKTQVSSSSRHKIHKVEAFDNVRSEGPDLNIKYAQRLVIVMKDTPPPPGMMLPDLVPAKQEPAPDKGQVGNSTPAIAVSNPPAAPPVPVQNDKSQPTAVSPLGQPRDPKEPRQPIFLKANFITAYVAARAGRHELHELLCEEGVEVQQAAKNPKDKGFDIKGEWLKVSRFAAGDVLVVFGDTRDFRSPARMTVGDMKLIGPEVTIDQVKNLATVYGAGAMIMPSNAKLDGTPADKTAPEGILTITWMGNMTFDGSVAIFRTGVQAYQEPASQKKDVKEISSMKCELMFVSLDDTVSFKQGQKQDKKPRVEKVFCYHKDDNDEQAARTPIERKVYIEDVLRTVSGDKLQSYSRIMAREVEVNNTANRFIARAAVGQGQVDHLAFGSPDALGPATKDNAGKPTGKDALVLKLTRVQNWEHLVSRGTATGRFSTFVGAIEVFHVPTDNPNLSLQNNKIPKDGFYLSCSQLDIFSQKVEGKDNKTRQIMEAKNRVTFQTTDHFGTADVVKFDEATDVLIFEGVNGNQVSLFKLSHVPGREHERFSGTKILYNRRTQQLSVEGGSSISSGINSGNGPPRPKQP